MNAFFKNLNKIEFVVTYACTGRCKHCSEGEHLTCSEYISADVATSAIRSVKSEYDLKTVMVFGGEPLLYPDTVCSIMNEAFALNVPHRQVITNGFFSSNSDVIRRVVKNLSESGVNDLLLSVDAFHQETIPLDIVKTFASEMRRRGVPIRLQPAWLVSADDNNRYNVETREILGRFDGMDIPINDGNVIFPEGNAKKYLAEYFTRNQPSNPYIENPRDVRCLSVSPNGDVLNGNLYTHDVIEIINDYNP